MSLHVQQRHTTPPFNRTGRGLLWAYAPQTDGTGSDPNPSVVRAFSPNAQGVLTEGVVAQPLMLPGPSGCFQGDLQRSYLMEIGLGLSGAVNSSGIGMFNNALNSSIDTYLAKPFGPPTGSAHIGAIGTLENNYVNMKTEWANGSLRKWALGALLDTRVCAQSFPWTPLVDVCSTAVTKVGGNSYLTQFKNLLAMKSNALKIVGLPAYGSLGVSINGGAEVAVAVDGNGDGSYDLGGTQFPCLIRYRVFDGPNLTGVLRGQFKVTDTYGGDTIGGTRVVLQAYPFTPKSIPALASWHRAEELAGATGAAINAWPDASGLGRNLVKSGVAAPKIQLAAYNGRTVARFDGSGQLLYNDAIANALRVKQSLTLAMALQFAAGNAVSRGLLSMMAGGSQGFNVSVGGGLAEQTLTGDNAGAISYPTSFGALNTIHILVLEFDALRSTVRGWWSSTARPSVGATPDLTAARLVQWSTSFPAFTLGTFYADVGAATPALYAIGDIGEVITYAKVLRPEDRKALLTYLNARWL